MAYTEKICSICGQSFTPTSGNQTICRSEECYKHYKTLEWKRAEEKKKSGRLLEKVCLGCSSLFITPDTKRKYCGAKECEQIRLQTKNRRAEDKRLTKRREFTRVTSESERE